MVATRLANFVFGQSPVCNRECLEESRALRAVYNRREPGKIINPRQLDRCMKSGVVMGLSEALKEEVIFDKSRVTNTNWSSYKILTMEEMPEIQVVQISRDDKGFGGGSEAANAIVSPAVAAGVHPRQIPLTPAYVKNLLRG